jgi:hypothetical protein
MNEMTKKKTNAILIVVLSLFVFVLTSSGAIADESFAPKVKLPKNMENRAMWIQMIEKWDIPSKNTVGLPAYPGAVVVAYAAASEMTANDVKYKTLPQLALSTTDEPAKVAAFYKEKLKDWKYKREFDMFDIFWTGPDEFNNLDVRESMTMPNITIMDSNPQENFFMPDAKTKITIVFKPVE